MKSLVGDDREEHTALVTEILRHYQGMIEEGDRQAKEMIQRLPSRVTEGEEPPKVRIQARPCGRMASPDCARICIAPLTGCGDRSPSDERRWVQAGRGDGPVVKYPQDFQ